MRGKPSRQRMWVPAGIVAGLALGALSAALAQGGGGGTNTTFTNSSLTSTSYESPPACSEVGTSRQEVTYTLRETIGPQCIGVGDRDVANATPACGGLPVASPPLDPYFGTVFLVVAGTVNQDTLTHTETIECVAAVPAAPPAALWALAGMLAAGGAFVVGRRVAVARSSRAG